MPSTDAPRPHSPPDNDRSRDPLDADDPPDAVADLLIDAVGTASEALEYIERARGHLYSFHQLAGHADFLFSDAARKLRQAGKADAADRIDTEVVGRNVIEGRWTFQVVDEFDDGYWEPVRAAVRELEARFQGGVRHLHEARLKQRRRTPGQPGHELRPH